MRYATAAAGAQRRVGVPATRRVGTAGLALALVVLSEGCYAARQCNDGWYCDGSCITYTGC